MTKNKYGFTVQQTAADSAAVELYCADHLAHYNYPADIKPASTLWFGICRTGQVWGVVGVKPVNESSIEVPDFYFHRSRWGTLAAYAALEYLKEFADTTGMEVITATPTWNTKQARALERVFSVDGPTHFIYKYKPETK